MLNKWNHGPRARIGMSFSFRLVPAIQIVCLLTLFGCQTAPTPAPPTANVPTEALADETVVAVLSKYQGKVHSVRSFVKTRIHTSEVKQTLRQSLIARNDNSLRLDTLSAFGQPMGVFIFQPGNTLVYDPEQNRMYTGADVWTMMHEVFGTTFNFSEFISVFLGKIPRYDHLEVRAIHWPQDPRRYVLEAEDPVRKESYRITLADTLLYPLKMIKYRNGQKQYEAEWENYDWVNQQYFPHKVTITRVDPADIVTVFYNNPQVNPAIPDDSFILSIPGQP